MTEVKCETCEGTGLVQEAPDVAEARAEVSRQENAYARACITAGSTIPSTDALDHALDAYAAAVRGEAEAWYMYYEAPERIAEARIAAIEAAVRSIES